MASNTIDIEIRARKEALVKELTEAGNLSQKQADKIARNFVKAGQEAEKANRKAAETTEKHWTGAAKKIASALGEGTIPKFEKLSGVGEALGGVMGASALQVATLTGGIAALAAGAIALNGTIQTTVANLDAEVAAVSDVQRAMSASAIEAIRPYTEAHRQAADAVAGMKFELAALTGSFDKTDAAFYTGAEFLLHYIRTGEGMEEWSRKTVDALNRAAEAARKAPRFFPGGPESITADALYQVPDALKPSTGGGGTRRAADRSDPGAERRKAAEAEIQQFMLDVYLNADKEREQARAAEHAEEQRLREQGLAAEAEYRAEQVRLADEASEKQKRAAERVHEANKTIVGNIGALVGGVGSLVSGLYEQAADGAEKGSAREKKARRSAFATAKAAALAQAAINTALGVTQALTLPIPLNYINAAIVGALGAVEIGAIAAKQMPTAHSGRIIGAAPAPDEQPIMALRGEAVMSRSAVERMGGEQAVSEANRGVGGGSGMVGVFSVVYEHRGFDAFASRDLRRPTGALRQAIHGSGTAGLIRRV